MVRNGQQIRLTREENAFLNGLLQENVSPQSVAEYNEWLDYALRDLSEADPEERLLKRVLEGMKIEE